MQRKWGLCAKLSPFAAIKSQIAIDVYRVNHTLLGELAYRLAPGVRVFVRGQAMSNQMLSEMPLLYNSLTARRFNERYGILSAGVMASF